MAEATGNPTSGDALRNRAISLVTKGYYVFPASVVRHPDGTKDLRTVEWASTSTTDLDVVAEWFADGHGWTDVCIDCGKSGIVVVDLDVRPSGDGRDVWHELEKEREDEVGPASKAVTRETPSGGRHLYFRNDPREVIGSRNDAWPHVDVKGHGGMVFAYGYVPKPETLPLRPGWLSERVRVVGGAAGIASRPAAGAAGGILAPDQTPAGSGFILPSRTETRAFTRAQAEAFCSGAWLALEAAPRGAINERLNVAAATMSHFVPEFWSAQDVESWLVEGQRRAWVAAGGADDGDYGAAISTIRSGLGQTSDPWRAVLAADAPATFGGRLDPDGAPLPAGSQEMADAVERLHAEMLDLDGLARLPRPEPLIRDLLFRNTLASVTGAYGSLKTFVALDMALSIASGTAWHGHAVSRGDVWYLLAEGVAGLRRRVEAWQDEWARWHEGEALDLDGFRVLPRAVQAASGPEWSVLVELARRRRPALIVIDTKARFSVGLEENSASETALLVARVDELKAASGGTVLVVHHTGWSGDRMRGSSAWGGALDTDVLVEKTGSDREPRAAVKVVKQKDAEPLAPFELAARVVLLGMDAEGDEVTSLAFNQDPFADNDRYTVSAADQIAGALDIKEEKHPEVLADLVAVMENIAPSGAAFGASQADAKRLMVAGVGKDIHPAVRRRVRSGKLAGLRGYHEPEVRHAFQYAAAYGWLEPAESPSKFTIRDETSRETALAKWREDREAERAQEVDKTD